MFALRCLCVCVCLWFVALFETVRKCVFPYGLRVICVYVYIRILFGLNVCVFVLFCVVVCD